jgi:hypothetical protein
MQEPSTAVAVQFTTQLVLLQGNNRANAQGQQSEVILLALVLHYVCRHVANVGAVWADD